MPGLNQVRRRVLLICGDDMEKVERLTTYLIVTQIFTFVDTLKAFESK